jgi:hemerythrin-like domain-containing protein
LICLNASVNLATRIVPMVNPIAAWNTEHTYFGRLLDQLEKQVDVLHTGERPNYELMSDIIFYLRDFADRLHHPREDAAFARLAQRRPGMELEFARLRQEHRVIARAGETLLTLLNEIVEGGVIARAEVEAAAATYLVYYRFHITNEDRNVLPHAAAVLTPADWEAVRAAVPVIRDPLFGPDPEERYRELRRQIAREAPSGP